MILKLRGKGQQGDILRPLDCNGEPALVPRARPRHAARKNFPPLLKERRQNLRLFVVDEVRFIHAETAHLFLADKTPFTALRGTAGAAAGAGTSALR
jgi:hypothetical protein